MSKRRNGSSAPEGFNNGVCGDQHLHDADRYNSRNLKEQGTKSLDCKKFEAGELSAAMSTPKSGGPNTPTAVRIRQVRRMMGYENSALGFAKFLGITAPRLSNIENGLPLSIEVAQMIVRKVPGLSLDWLYNGKLEAVPLAVQRALEAAVEHPAEAPGKARTRSPSTRD